MSEGGTLPPLEGSVNIDMKSMLNDEPRRGSDTPQDEEAINNYARSQAASSTYEMPLVESKVKARCKELPPFGVPEILIGLSGALMAIGILVNLYARLTHSDREYTIYPCFLLAFFTAFGLRAMIPSVIIQGVLVIYMGFLFDPRDLLAGKRTWGKFKLTVAYVILFGILLGWAVKACVIYGHHCCRPRGALYRRFARSSRQDKESKDVEAETSEVFRKWVENEMRLLKQRTLGISENSSNDSKTTTRSSRFPAKPGTKSPPNIARADLKRKMSIRSENLPYFRDGVHRDVGVLNSAFQNAGFYHDNRYFPSFKCWEVATAVGVAASSVTVGISESDKNFTASGLILRLMHLTAVLMSLSRFDSKYLGWTIAIFVLLALEGLVVVILINIESSDFARRMLTYIGVFVLFAIWSVRGGFECAYQIEKRGKKSEKKAIQQAHLQVRGFQTGDVMLTGSVASLVDYAARLGTASAWGHVAVVVKDVGPLERALFAIGHWLQRMPRPVKAWVLETTGGLSAIDLASECIEALTKEQIEESKVEICVVDMLNLLAKVKTVQKRLLEGGVEAYSPPPAAEAHCQKRPCKIPFSRYGVYVVEAVGSGSRLLSVEKFMDTWYLSKREFVAWRPLYRKSQDGKVTQDLKMDMKLALKLAGHPYVTPCELITGPFFRARARRCCCGGDDVEMLPFFCSSLVGLVYSHYGLFDTDWKKLTPGDFGDDGAQTSVVNTMRDGWSLGTPLYLSKRKKPLMQRIRATFAAMIDFRNAVAATAGWGAADDKNSPSAGDAKISPSGSSGDVKQTDAKTDDTKQRRDDNSSDDEEEDTAGCFG